MILQRFYGSVIGNSDKLADMQKNSARLARKNATSDICHVLLDV